MKMSYNIWWLYVIRVVNLREKFLPGPGFKPGFPDYKLYGHMQNEEIQNALL